MQSKSLIILILTLLIFSFSIAGDKPGARISFTKPTLEGILDTMQINNIFLPYQNDGSTADDANAFFPNGTDLSFLFQGGIAASGFIKGQLRASWMARASLIQEYQPGNWDTDPLDAKAKFYVVTANDGPGSDAYVAWADAVASGADFQDVDGDGIFDPVIDRPDLLGDRTSYCVYNDGTREDIRSEGLQTDPMGLEVRQTVWAFARADELGNVVFLRYRFINVGGEDIQDMIFSIWTDPDIGDAENDLIGCDTTFSLGYIYNDGDDDVYGSSSPAFGVDFFQGPVVNSPGDTAYLYRGPWFGVDTLLDKRNLPMTSFVFYNNAGETDPFPSPQQNVERARDYQIGGFNGHREPIDPTVFGVGGTAQDNPKYFYTGNPEAGTGWRDTEAKDKRFMVNTGPFQLPAWVDENGNGRPDNIEPGVQDIVVAYVVGQGSSPTNSVTVLKEVDEIAQLAYNANFFVAGPPPPPQVTIRTFDRKIEFVIDLDANGTIDYDASDELLNRQVFEGVKIYQFASPSTSEFESGTLNRKLLTSFDLTNPYIDIYQTKGLETFQIYAGNNNFEVAEDGAAIIRYTVETDAFATEPPGLLLNSVEYYFAVTAFSINLPFLIDQRNGAWVGPSGSLLENSLSGPQFYTVTPGSDENRPFKGDTALYTGSRTAVFTSDVPRGKVVVDVVNRDDLTGDDYQVTFSENGNVWHLLNADTGDSLLQDVPFQTTDPEDWSNFPIVDGLSIRVINVEDKLDTAVAIADSPEDVWIEGLGGYSNSAVFNNSISLVKLERPNLSNIAKTEYFPVLIEFHTSNVAQGYAYFQNFSRVREVQEIYIKAFDVTDPDQPRQVNIAFEVFPSSGFQFDITTNPQIMVFKSDYNLDNIYSGVPDSTFKADSYQIMQFTPIADSLIQTARFDIDIQPKYPNSDSDVFTISSSILSPVSSPQTLRDQLEMVNVVPNPYWAYSGYERSYDTPVLKFTHLPRSVTIRVFDLAGNLIRTLTKNDETNELSWNLRNEASLKIASGIYIAFVEAPGIGSKILKFAVIQREERLDRY